MSGRAVDKLPSFVLFLVVCSYLQLPKCVNADSGYANVKGESELLTTQKEGPTLKLGVNQSDFRSRPSDIKPWIGDINPSKGLNGALEARAFKNELILFVDVRADSVYQAYSSLAALGLNHVLWLAHDEAMCKASQQLLPELGCAWSSQPIPSQLVGMRRMAVKRLMLLARIVRLGVNVLALDADVVVFRDPYVHLKSPPLSDKQLVVMRGTRMGSLNAGALYVQGAARLGPVAWTLAEAAERQLRFLEFQVELPSNRPLAAATAAAAAASGAAGSRGLSSSSDDADVSMGSADQDLPAAAAAAMASVGDVRPLSAADLRAARALLHLPPGNSSSGAGGSDELQRLRGLLQQAGGTSGAGGSYRRIPRAAASLCDPSLMLSDVVLSAMAKRPVWWFCFRPGGLGYTAGAEGRSKAVMQAAMEWDRKHLAALGLSEGGGLRELYQREPVRINSREQPDLVTLAGAGAYSLLWAPLEVPAAAAAGAGAGGAAGKQAQQAEGADLVPHEQAYWRAHATQPGSETEQFQQLLSEDKKGELRRGRSERRSRALLAQAEAEAAPGGGSGSRSRVNSGAQATVAAAGAGADLPAEGSAVTAAAAAAAASSSGTTATDRFGGAAAAVGQRHRALQQQQQQRASTWSSGPGTEKVALAPEWLFTTFAARGVLGLWDARLTGSPPRQVVGHVGRVPGTGPGRDAVRMAYGQYNFSLAARLHTSVAAALAADVLNEQQQSSAGSASGTSSGIGSASSSTGGSSGAASGGAIGGSGLPRMLALLPAFPLATNSTTRQQWHSVLRGLAQVAALSGRMLVWPDPACASSWIQPNPVPRGRKAVPLQANPSIIPYTSADGVLRCMMHEVLTSRCLYDRSAAGGAWQWWRAQQAATDDSLLAAAMWRANSGSAGAGKRRARKGGAGARGQRQASPQPDGVPVLRGMLSVEFDHLASALPQDFRQPWAANTMMLTTATASSGGSSSGNSTSTGSSGGNSGGGSSSGGSWQQQQRPLQVDAAAVVAELQKVNHQPVVWIGQHLQVRGLSDQALAAYEAFQKQCQALT